MAQHFLTAMAYSKRGKLLSIGHNSYVKTHPLQAQLGAKTGKPNAIYLHAEVAALLKAKEPVHKLVITRFGKDGRPLLAKPCPACREAIKLFNVKVVQHT